MNLNFSVEFKVLFVFTHIFKIRKKTEHYVLAPFLRWKTVEGRRFFLIIYVLKIDKF